MEPNTYSRTVRALRAGLLIASVLVVAGGIGPARALDPGAVIELETPTLTEPADGAAATTATAGEELVGLFALSPGQCGAAGVDSGAWFRMVDPTGRFIENNDSPCQDRTWTPLAPGTDGGLLTGAYQPHPDPAFTGNHGAANRITEPQAFFGTRFSTATNPTDPQTGTAVGAPIITHDGAGNLGGDVRAFAAAWQNQHFNQGAPKPNGSTPGGTELPAGTYDPETGTYSIGWSSLIEGGPFDGFTGIWHFEGTFRSSGAGGGAPSSADGATSPGGAAGAGSPSSAGRTTAAGGQTGAITADPLARTGGGSARAGLALLAAAALLRAAGGLRRSSQ